MRKEADDSPRPPSVSRVALLLFGSGTCALIYQTAWFREMRLVFGMSTAASAAVLAIFMGGVGLGGWFLGRRVDRHSRPLAFYGMLEILIALSSAVTPFLVDLARASYILAGGTERLGMVAGSALRLALSALVLAIPTVLMGGTLPAAARAVESDADVGRRKLALLYGANTLGAVFGAVLSTFLLLELLGIRHMLWASVAVNLLVGLAALRMAKETGPGAAARHAGHPPPEPGVPPRPDAPPPDAWRAPAGFVLASAAVVGFAFFLMELVWYRMLAPILGGSSYTFGLILAVALTGIGLGGAAAGTLRPDRSSTLKGFALTCSLEAMFLALPFALGDRLAIFALQIRPVGALGLLAQVLGWTIIAAVVVLPAAFVSGVQFPMLIGLLGRGRHGVGKDAGTAYAWNTVGAIAGSLAGGFGILPALSATGTWRLVGALLAVLGIVAAALSLKERGSRTLRLAPVLAALATLALLAATGPTAAWRHTPIGAGRAKLPADNANGIRSFVNEANRTIPWSADGVESALALQAADGYAFVVSGKIDGSIWADAPTQVMSGLIGALLHPDPKRAFVVGLGTGSTAGWLGAVPSIDRVDVVELEPAILEVARACAPANRDVLDNPKVVTSYGDAREVLLTGTDRYDVIFSEPSNPYRVGIASLFTLEFYEAVRGRLTDDGVFVQWLQSYEVDSTTVRTVMATLSHVFGSVEVWETKPGDMLLIASCEPVRIDLARLRDRLARPPYRDAFLAVWRVTDVEGFLAHFLARSTLTRTVANLVGDNLNTDDLNVVEFGFARALGQWTRFDIEDLRAAARERGEDRPALDGGDVDWRRVQEEAIRTMILEEDKPALPPTLSGEQKTRLRALRRFVEGNFREGLETWKAQPRPFEGPFEVALAGEALADIGDEAAAAHAEALRAWEPVEADAILGRLRLRQGRLDEATAALERAFTGYRTDPWPLHFLMLRALGLPAEIARKDATLGRRLYAAIRQPFAVGMLEDRRRAEVVRLTLAAGAGDLCADALGALERWVPWNRAHLLARRACFADAGDERAAGARDDVDEFLSNEPARFDQGLVGPRQGEPAP